MLRSIPLRLKLVTALVLPMLVVGGYLYFDIDESIDRREVASAQRDEVEAFEAVSALSGAIGLEQLLISSRASDADQLADARAATDRAYDALRTGETAIGSDRLQVIDGHYGSLLSIRESLGDEPTEARLRANIELRNGEGRTGPYSTSLSDLSDLPLDVLAAFEFDAGAIDDVATAALVDDYFLVQRARADVRRESATLTRVATLPGNLVDAEVTESVTAVIAKTDESLEVLAQLASIDVAGEIDSMLVAPAWTRYAGYRVAVEASDVGQRVDIDEAELQAAAGAVDTVLQDEAEQVVRELQDRASTSVFDANRDVIISGLIGLWLVIGVGLLLRFLYRAIKRPLEQLTEQAGHVARTELPMVIEQMRRGEVDEVPEIDLIPVESKDEIGSLVSAFNDMHRSAVDLAAGQAESRRVVADMFVNLGRRNQRLVGRLLNGLSMLEQHEEDPDKLAALYDLDHTATRMRRNAESLLVLAGAGQARRWDEPVSIHDVARAAIGEVENYQRVHIDVQGEERLDGSVVADVTHLLAELAENALTFSPPNSPVELVAGQTSAGYVIAVSDHGIGMLPEAIEEANGRISGAAREEESPSEFLGHYVVGRLGARHGIRVELTEGPAGGVTARAWVPSHLLIDPTIIVPGEADPAADLRGGLPAATPAPPAPPAAPVEPSAPAPSLQAPDVSTPSTAPVDPLLMPLGGTNPIDTALPDEPVAPLAPSTDATDFLSSLEASGVQRRTSKLPEATEPAPTAEMPSAPAPAPAPAPGPTAEAQASGGDLSSLSTSAVTDLVEPVAPAPTVPAETTTTASAPAPAPAMQPASIESLVASTALAQPETTSPAPAAPPAPAPPAGGADGPFGSPRRTPGANMPRTELIGSIVGSMGSIFGDDDRSDAAPAADDAAAASATEQALSAVRMATAAAEPGPDPLSIDPDQIRSALSGFQQGIRRADREAEET